MRRLPLISMLLLFSTLSYGQAWSGVLSASRAIDWGSAGLPATFPDGETTPNGWTPPTRTQCGSTLTPSGGNDVTQIVSALSACTAGHYVLLGSGTFEINTSLFISPGYIGGINNVSLRGSGAQSTKVKVGSGGSINIGAASGGGSCTLTSGSNYAQGSTTLTCSGSTPPVGQPAWLAQCDTGTSGSGAGNGGTNCQTGTVADNGGVWICGQMTVCSNQTATVPNHAHEQQTVLVRAVSGTCSSSCTVSISPGLFMSNWAYAQNPVLNWNSTTYTSIGVGFEDMTVDFTSGTSNYGSFSFGDVYASWVKGIRFIGPSAGGCCAISISQAGNSLFMNNYAYDANPASGTGGGLTMSWGSDSGVLLLNNFMQGSTINELEGTGFDSGNVLAYNYFRDSTTSQVYNSDAEHSGSPNFILREGNQFGVSEDDGTWGTHNFDTWFRNNISCYDGPYIGETAPRGIIIDNYARFENAVANILNASGACTSYQGNGSTPFEFGFGESDPLAESTSMRWGNCDTVNNACRFVSSELPSGLPSPNTSYSNAIPGSDTLPASFFMDSATSHANGGTGLSWWKVCTTWTTFPTSCSASQTNPFPTAGPDVSGGPYVAGTGSAYDVPAGLAYKSLPVDATYQNSYTITASSWSGGTETLTVSGLPSSNANLNGGFQLSGMNSACAPSSGVSYTGGYRSDGEILMTGSSTTTISYALVSNPGVSCTGTLKWPDVRQFDELVYENDPSGNSAIAPPTGLSAAVAP
jgi:hypothetical protein